MKQIEKKRNARLEKQIMNEFSILRELVPLPTSRTTRTS